MNRMYSRIVVVFFGVLLLHSTAFPAALEGEVGNSPEWGSGYLKFAEPQSFHKGDTLKLKVDGTAKKVVVRLLRKGDASDNASGVVGGVREVPDTKVVEVVLDADVADVVQISVHGNEKPWGLVDLGKGNGPAKLIGVEVSQPDLESAKKAPATGEFVLLKGELGVSTQWNSGWLTLAKPQAFHKGDILKIKVGGRAEKVVVRLVQKGMAPDKAVGIVGGARDVPKSKVIEISLDADLDEVIQISVHGGEKPWGLYDLGKANGSAELVSVELVEVSAHSPKEAKASDKDEYTQLKGEAGISEQWKSGWLDLDKAQTFHKGDKLKLKIGGAANKVVVRLLEKGTDPNSPSGIIGGVREVPDSRVLEVTLDADLTDVIQVSVHGGENPWGIYKLGKDNGAAALTNCGFAKVSK